MPGRYIMMGKLRPGAKLCCRLLGITRAVQQPTLDGDV